MAEATVTIYVATTLARVPLAATDTFTEGTNLVLNVQSLDDYTPPPRDSVIFSPADGTVLTTTGAIPILGAAYAASGLEGLLLWADTTVIAAIPYNGVITDTTWSVNWTPPGDGQYVLEPAAVEVGSIIEDARTPVTITVDTLPPAITIDSNGITTDQQVAGPLVEVSGTASDLAGVTRVEFRYETPGSGYGPWQRAEYDPDTGIWRYELSLGTLVDDTTVFVGARAFDFAGNVTETGNAISVVILPPAAVTIGAAYENGGRTPLTEGELVALAAPTLVLTWTESNDGSFSVDYRAGWSSSPDPADPWLDEASYSGVGEHSTVVAGVVADPGWVPLVDLEIRTRPGAVLDTLSCRDATPYDGAWQCPYNFGNLSGLAGVEVRARATDSFGQTGPWSAWRALTVDDAPPTVSLTTDMDLILQAGFLSRDERVWQGLLADDYAPQSVEVCVAGACRSAGATDGTWQQSLPLPAADGLSATVVITGQDAAGNLSTPLQQPVMLDTVPPVLTVLEAVTQTVTTGAGAPLTILRGSHSDGGGLAEIYARVQGPAGNYWTALRRSGDSWHLAPELALLGRYTITLQAYDRAGNVSSYGPFYVTVTGKGSTELYLPLVLE